MKYNNMVCAFALTEQISDISFCKALFYMKQFKHNVVELKQAN